MIELYCHHCGQRMEIADQYAGQAGTCKNCGKTIVVPASSSKSALKAVAQRQPSAVPYKWIGATAAVVALLAIGAYVLFRPDGSAPTQTTAASNTTPIQNETASGRTVTFPSDRAVGMVILADQGTWGWYGKYLGEVRGPFHVPLGKELGIHVRKEDSADLSFLKDFAPDDLDFLYLHHPAMTDNQLRNVVHLTGLNTLSIEFCDIGDSGLRILSGLTQITDFGLVGSNISDAGIGTLLGFTRLKGLHMAGTRVTHRGVGRLKALPSLVNITLSTSMITPPMVDALKEFPNLKGLYMNTLGENDGENFPLAPGVILLLKDLSQLEELMFWGELIDDSLVPSLSQLTFLKGIKFAYGTSVTPAGRNELRRALPDCNVVP